MRRFGIAASAAMMLLVLAAEVTGSINVVEGETPEHDNAAPVQVELSADGTLNGQENSIQFCLAKNIDKSHQRAIKIFDTFGKETFLELEGDNVKGPICSSLLPASDFVGSTKVEFWKANPNTRFGASELLTTQYYKATSLRGKKVLFLYLK